MNLRLVKFRQVDWGDGIERFVWVNPNYIAGILPGEKSSTIWMGMGQHWGVEGDAVAVLEGAFKALGEK